MSNNGGRTRRTLMPEPEEEFAQRGAEVLEVVPSKAEDMQNGARLTLAQLVPEPEQGSVRPGVEALEAVVPSMMRLNHLPSLIACCHASKLQLQELLPLRLPGARRGLVAPRTSTWRHKLATWTGGLARRSCLLLRRAQVQEHSVVNLFEDQTPAIPQCATGISFAITSTAMQ